MSDNDRVTLQFEQDQPCSLQDCPPGFFLFNGLLCLKSEYGGANVEAYVESGEYFWGGAKSKEERDALIVTPVFPVPF
ncbi:hypothetical protein [Caballeronia sp. LZ001]|uniref:hypothetical protein n=1 Tax=Caballeronia sp. LZ001 TaxID=3038553 RepID=UPI0028547D13|nr:hypothetical protein [Caballeronia sp. LZ001]MDR5801148.1 hypothetical protein [Caballeronia sp. LZ001]